MDNFQQSPPPIQQNSTPPQTTPIVPEPAKSKRWLYILGGILIVGVVTMASTILLKNNSPQLQLEKQLSNGTTAISCPLKAGQFIGRILSKARPFIAEILDYSLESIKDDSSSNQPYDFVGNGRPLIVDNLANVTDNTGAKVGDIILGQYSHGTCDAGEELGFCSYVNILEKGNNPSAYCSNEENLKYVDRKNPIVLALTDYDENSLLTVRENGDLHYVDYWGKTVPPRNIKREDIDSLIQLGRNAKLIAYSNRSREESRRIVISLDGRVTYFTVTNEFKEKVPSEVENFVTKIIAVEKSILQQAGYKLTVTASYPLLIWGGQKSFSEYIAQKGMIDYRNDLTDTELKEIYVYHPNLSDLLKKHGKVFFKEGQRVYEVVIYDFKPNVPVGHEQEETDSGFTGFSYWQEQDINLKAVPSEGINITDEIVARNKIQLQSRDDRFIIQGDTVFVVALQRI